jgi:hypothetical protein
VAVVVVVAVGIAIVIASPAGATITRGNPSCRGSRRANHPSGSRLRFMPT